MHITPMHETKVDLGLGQNLTVRTLMLQNRAEPFMSMREIVQLHYDEWPDFGTPAEPATILSLVKYLNEITSQREKGKNAPIIVHCSAGCGRTGTFCTVDSVVNQLDKMEDDGGEKDLILETVRGLREQRMSLVQTLRQYVLCYECVLHYLLDKVSITSEDNRMDIG
jgi:tyrosine-protein phosphatase 2/3